MIILRLNKDLTKKNMIKNNKKMIVIAATINIIIYLLQCVGFNNNVYQISRYQNLVVSFTAKIMKQILSMVHEI
jgi:hypothetical protein